MLQLKSLARSSLSKVATRSMSGGGQKLECFIDGQKVCKFLSCILCMCMNVQFIVSIHLLTKSIDV